MKYSFRITIALLAFLLGIAAFLFWSGLRIPHPQLSSVSESNQIPPVKIEGKVNLRFLECAGKRSAFILENLTDHPIYARVQRVDYWKEYKDADIELGVHLIEYKAPNSQKFEDASPMWDAPMPFRMISPYSKVRYGVDLWKGQGEYKVKVPYMEDAEVARRLNEDWVSIIKQDFERVKASWKEVESDVITNHCQ
jgi:hypothetical protein